MTTHSDVVDMLAKNLVVSGKLEGRDKREIANDLISPKSSSINPGDFSLKLSKEQEKKLDSFKEELEKSWSDETPKLIDEHHNQVREIIELEEEVKSEIKTALGEDRELEKIAKSLKDPKLYAIADKERDEIRELSNNLKSLGEQAKRARKLESKLSSLQDIIDTENVEEEIEVVIAKITGLKDNIERDGTGSEDDDGKDFKTRFSELKSNKQIIPDYLGEKGGTYFYSPLKITEDKSAQIMPFQGFNIYISADEDTFFDIVNLLISEDCKFGFKYRPGKNTLKIIPLFDMNKKDGVPYYQGIDEDENSIKWYASGDKELKKVRKKLNNLFIDQNTHNFDHVLSVLNSSYSSIITKVNYERVENGLGCKIIIENKDGDEEKKVPDKKGFLGVKNVHDSKIEIKKERNPKDIVNKVYNKLDFYSL